MVMKDDALRALERGELKRARGARTEMQMAKHAAANYFKKDNRINIRIAGADLDMLKKRAAEEGLPYQTLISSVLHKFVSGRLVGR